MNEYGYWGIFLLLLVETIFPPIPSGVILTFSGFMTVHTNLNIWLVHFCATSATILGCIVLYLFGRLINAERLEHLLAGKVGETLHLPPEKIRIAKEWFYKHGAIPVFVGQLIPVIRNIISIPAGMVNMSFDKFLICSTGGIIIWNTVWIWMGLLAETTRELALRFFNVYLAYGLLGIVLIILIFSAIRYQRRIIKK